ncbi:MAG TPA: ATP-binding cassette domain-containing protein, partial [Caulobacteraceae bacterium]
MTALLTLDNLTQLSPDGRVLFERLTLSLGRERTGLVGRNGVGKTTLVRLILGEAEPAAGAVAVAGRVAALRQQLSPPPGATLADLLGVAAPLAALARLEAGQGGEADFAAADWTLSQRTLAALAEMGLADAALDRPAATLSGGQATRAALAALIVAEPDFIVMDEPTNNLDADGRAVVAAMLERWRGGALVVSHDRSLLRRMDRIVELTSLGASVYGGNYDLYAARKAEAEAAAARGLEQAREALARTERGIQASRERQASRDAAGRRSRAKNDMPKMMLNARAEQAETTGGALSRLAERQRAEAERDLADAEARIERVRRLAFELPPSGLPAGRQVLSFDEVGFAWPPGTEGGGAPVLGGVSFRLVGPERIAVTGPNGAGKTTLIRLALGELAPTAGHVRRGVPAALLDQRAAQLRDDETLLENFRRLNPVADANGAH